MKNNIHLPYPDKVRGWNKSVGFLISKYARVLKKIPLHERNSIYTQMLQAACDYWFGKNVYKITKASYDYLSGKMNYETEKGELTLQEKSFTKRKPRFIDTKGTA